MLALFHVTQLRSEYDRLGNRMWSDMINSGWNAMVEDASEFNVSFTTFIFCRKVSVNAEIQPCILKTR